MYYTQHRRNTTKLYGHANAVKNPTVEPHYQNNNPIPNPSQMLISTLPKGTETTEMYDRLNCRHDTFSSFDSTEFYFSQGNFSGADYQEVDFVYPSQPKNIPAPKVNIYSEQRQLARPAQPTDQPNSMFTYWDNTKTLNSYVPTKKDKDKEQRFEKEHEQKEQQQNLHIYHDEMMFDMEM